MPEIVWTGIRWRVTLLYTGRGLQTLNSERISEEMMVAIIDDKTCTTSCSGLRNELPERSRQFPTFGANLYASCPCACSEARRRGGE